jgi:hypothetical protein
VVEESLNLFHKSFNHVFVNIERLPKKCCFGEKMTTVYREILMQKVIDNPIVSIHVVWIIWKNKFISKELC